MQLKKVGALTLTVALVGAWACSSSKKEHDTPLPASGAPTAAPPFDAAALPPAEPGEPEWHAVLERDPAPSRVVYALSDVHGAADRLTALLAGAGIAKPTWAAGDAILLVLGDLFDKGAQGLEVIDALRALETAAKAAGGEVIVLAGNHEAEFFVDPKNSKATASDGFDVELGAKGIDPVLVSIGAEPHGAWLRSHAIAARVRKWFFSHAGNTKGRNVADLDLALRAAVATHANWLDPELVAADSILEARDWYTDPNVAAANARALGVSHIVFGHDPNAIGSRGDIGTAQNALLFRIDCGMSPDVNDSQGKVLRIRTEGPVEVAEQISHDGNVHELWRGPP